LKIQYFPSQIFVIRKNKSENFSISENNIISVENALVVVGYVEGNRGNMDPANVDLRIGQCLLWTAQLGKILEFRGQLE
jgi:hypothetical protein